MDNFREVVDVLAVGSLGLAALQIYLTVNKLWKRKHEPAVADSISILGEALGLGPSAVLGLYFVLAGQWAGVIDHALWSAAALVTIVVGTGRWVEGRRGRSFLTLLRDALNLERSEVGDLAKAILGRGNANRVVAILVQLALIDDDLALEEQRYIDTFAHGWGVRIDWRGVRQQAPNTEISYVRLRESAVEYLSTSPPSQQVAQLMDVVNRLINADEFRSEEEELIQSELEGLFNRYLNDSGRPQYALAVVPQSEKQDRALANLLPHLGKQTVEGGSAYLVGEYFTEQLGNVVGQQYRDLGFFTTMVKTTALV